ncbi:mediator of RNA polymerase II transcription subunit 13-like isoform X4 [Myzus persicae]|uniref:mediator of RNA polymerase II transcription subunit 13-like isoform X4 n=1 Tax=Myzus persicae TaxID=13164 RepID=UPI000B936D53|nr:mediator of RNA polymerase II transcription subunit 13-like isoform X4 [Myzus persicae]
MTHSSHQTNGASLEDCHTNFFALTDLCGIKWRKFVHCSAGPEGPPDWGGGPGGGTNACGSVLEDPVLSSYTRCLTHDMLAVWRRVSLPPANSQQTSLDPLVPAPPTPIPALPPALSLKASKELWIFWYGEEPDLTGLVSPQLLLNEGDNGSWESGLSYECRSLLFKALHNLIERCLMSREFIRLGKWFVQPYSSSEKLDSSSASHLSFSFAFFVHGESTVCASIDVRQHSVVRTLSKEHLAQASSQPQNGTNIQVMLAPFGLAGTLTGHVYKNMDAETSRMMDEWSHFYPVVNNNGPNELSPAVEVLVGGVKMRYPSCYVLVTDLDDSTAELYKSQNTHQTTPQQQQQQQQQPPQLHQQPQPQIVPKQQLFATKHQHHPDTIIYALDNAVASIPERAWQDCVLGSLHTEQNPPSRPESPTLGQWHLSDPLQKLTCSCTRSTRLCPTDSPCGLDSVPPLPSVPTPPSAGQPAPLSIPPPMLSPHDEKIPITPLSVDFQPKSVSSVSNQVFSPYPSSAPASQEPVKSGRESNSGTPAPPSNTVSIPATTPTATTPVPMQTQSSSAYITLKRPQLSSKDYEANLVEEEIMPSKLLYDYSCIDAWLYHPVKKFKPIVPKQEPITRINNVMDNPASPPQVYIRRDTSVPILPVEPSEISINNFSSFEELRNNALRFKGGRSDPYEFDEESGACSSNNIMISNDYKLNTSMAVMKNEDIKKEYDPGLMNGNRCTNDSMRDLDHMFDNSDDLSSDEAVAALQMQTPPGSNKPDDCLGGGLTTLLVRPPRGSGGGSGGGVLRPEELVKMFPTPPSLEHNPIASPCPDMDLLPPRTYQTNSYMGSPQHDHIDDWSYVYKPPAIAKMVGSSKYAPLTNLPSQNLPPLIVPSNCVYKPSSFVYHASSQPQQIQHHPPQPEKPNQIVPPPASSANNNLLPNMNRNNHYHHPIMMSPSPHSAPWPGGGNQYHRPPQQQIQQHQQVPPPPYSPALSQHHNMNVVPTNMSPPVPEANSIVVNVLLTDSLLNVFRDHNFDSCTLCVCNAGPKVVGNIKGTDAAVYLTHTLTPNGYSSQYQQHHMSVGIPGDEDGIRCSCGFSAVVNRRLSHKSGLFPEDEAEITGLIEDSPVRVDDNSMNPDVLELVREQCAAVIYSSCSSLVRAAAKFPINHPPQTATVNMLEFTDTNQVALLALEQGRLAKLEGGMNNHWQVEHHRWPGHHQQSLPPLNNNSPPVHRWAYSQAPGPRSSRQLIRVMRTLQPLLQEAIQRRSVTTRLWEPYTVTGPLTWRQFHRLAGRGTEDRCEPQPIPPILVGHDKDWVAVAPLALHYWDKLLLEPFSYSRDVAYIVVSPDNEFILQRTRAFFKELSAAYEINRLGRHCPITKVLRDGILRVGKSAAAKLAKEPVDEWFSMLGENHQSSMLKLYAQVCRHYLAPQLSQFSMDKTLLDPPEGSIPRPPPSPMPPPASLTPNSVESPVSSNERAPTPKSDGLDDSSSGSQADKSFNSNGDNSHCEEDDGEVPAIVIYLVEPFSIGKDSSNLARIACHGLLRCYNTVLATLPEAIRSNISVQLISLESVLELGRSSDHLKMSDNMRTLALSVFSQCRRYLTHTANIKALTGFGTAAMTELFLKNKDEKSRTAYKAYTPPFILASYRNNKTGRTDSGIAGDNMSGGGDSLSNLGGPNGTGSPSGTDQQCSVLYASYCISEDQRWILATATDEQGILLETATINIYVPNNRRRKSPARRVGLQKLMDFILGVMSQSVTPWRLVVGRVGRIGHGELKGWSWLLSRKALMKASRHLKESCGQCSLLYQKSDVPSVVSACLVSLEPDSSLRLMTDQFTPDERFSQASVACQLSTPRDVSATHILVFPTSATTQSSQTAFQEQQINGPELGDDELFSAFNEEDMQSMEGMGDFNDIFSTWNDSDAVGNTSLGLPSGGVSGVLGGPSSNVIGGVMGSGSLGGSIGMGRGSMGPRGDCSSQPGSPPSSQPCSPFACGSSSYRNGGSCIDGHEEVGALLQQPLALGYLVSTAPTGRMPTWFWASCAPDIEKCSPAFLKSALHMHTVQLPNNADPAAADLLHPTSAVSAHPLDSQYTTDVLRYVLEGYNALSWLSLDSNTHDRMSCLPIHMQVLMQLYHTMNALI